MAKKASVSTRKKTFKKKEKKVIPQGIVHVQASFNNTLVSITDLEGNLVSASSAGALGFNGSRKGTPFAAQQAATKAATLAKEAGMQVCEVRVKGPGSGRESAIRAVQSAGIDVRVIKDVTPIPHNGCRPPKRRRV
jgi:small subunit ribosomal protein S11